MSENSKKKSRVTSQDFLRFLLLEIEHPDEVPVSQEMAETDVAKSEEFFDAKKIREMRKAIAPDAAHTPIASHIANAAMTARKHYLPISRDQIATDRLYVSDDGEPSEIVEYNCIKRRELTSSTNRYKNAYYTPDRYKIVDWSRYKRQMRALVAHWREKDVSKSLLQDRRGSGDIIARTILTQGIEHMADISTIKVQNQDTPNQRIDRAVERFADTGDPFSLDDVFPDIGMLPKDATPGMTARYNHMLGGKYKKEYILKTLHRLLLRGMPIHYIAQQFNVRPESVNKWIKELKERLKKEATTVNLYDIAGDSLAFYNEVRSMGMVNATTAGKVSEKMRALDVALTAENSKHRFLAGAGLYDVQRLGREIGHDPNTKKATQIIDMAKDIMQDTFVMPPEAPAQEEDDIKDDERVFF